MSFWSAIAGKISDTIVRTVWINSSTHNLATMDYTISKSFDGDVFYTQNWLDISAATTDFLMAPANTTKWPRFFFEISTEGEFTIDFYEDSTVSANGVPFPVFNVNRNSATTSGMGVYLGPTITTLGPNIFSAIVGAGRTLGGNLGSRIPIILKQNSKYIGRITKIGAGTLWISFYGVWDEHTAKN